MEGAPKDLTPENLVRLLELRPHPEGGYYRETYRSGLVIPASVLPERYRGPRPASTAIYYLLTSGQTSAPHRVASDEVWHFYLGDPLELLVLSPEGDLEIAYLGTDLASGERPQKVVPAGYWQAAKLARSGRWSLVGCTVAPGFQFEDFELGRKEDLLARFPEHRDVLEGFFAT